MTRTGSLPHEEFATCMAALTAKEAAAILAPMQVLDFRTVAREGAAQIPDQADRIMKWLLRHDIAKEQIDKHGKRVLDTLDRALPESVLADKIRAQMTYLEKQPVAELREELISQLSTRLGVVRPEGSTGSQWYHAVLIKLANVKLGRDDEKIPTSGKDDRALTREIHRKLVAYMLKNLEKMMARDRTSPVYEEREERAFLEELRRSLSELDPDGQREVLRKLRIDSLATDELRKAFRSGTLMAAAIAGAEAAGGALFIFATTVVHAVFTTLLGVTLQFTTYMAITALLGAILTPVGELVIITTVVGVSLIRGRHKLNRFLAAQAWLQVLLVGSASRPG